MASFIEFPIFTGVSGDLRPWISWLEAFFVREKFKKLEKMNLAQSLLEGEAEAWFYLIQKTLIFYSWRELKEKLLLRFGDVADSDRIRLIAEQDRFLMEIRDEARIRRRKTTSIPEKVTIWDTETEALIPTDTIPVINLTESRDSISATKSIQEAISESVLDGDASIEKEESYEATIVKVEDDSTMFQVSDSLEEESIHQKQVPHSSLEPSLSFSSEPLDVSASWPCAIVSNNPVHSQSVLDCVTSKTNAYQVFDKTSSYTESLKPKTKRKLRLSLKTWMFKFKHTSKKRKSLDVKFFSVEEIVAGCEKKLFDRFQTSPSYALDVINKTSKPWETHTPFTSTPVASVHFLSFAVGTAANWSSGLSQNRQVWEPGGVLADHVLEDNVEAGSKGLAYAGCVLMGMNCAGLGSGKAELLATGQQMQRTDLFSELTCSQNKKQMLGYKTRMFKYKSSLRITRSASRDMNQFVGFMKFQLKHKWRSKHLHTISALGFCLSSVFSTVPSATSGRLQGLLEQVLQKDDEAYPQILDKLQLNLKQGMDVHGASGLRLFLCQQKFSSIWHRWRRKDSDLEVQLKERALVQSSVSPELLDEAVWIPEVGCRELLVKWQDHDASENFWMFSKDFVQLYPSSKLEDKLVFAGGSIDTIKQSYYRKKKPWVEREGFSCKEALEGNGGFAVSLEV